MVRTARHIETLESPLVHRVDADIGWIKGWEVAVPVDLNYLPNTEGDRSSAPCAFASVHALTVILWIGTGGFHLRRIYNMVVARAHHNCYHEIASLVPIAHLPSRACRDNMVCHQSHTNERTTDFAKLVLAPRECLALSPILVLEELRMLRSLTRQTVYSMACSRSPVSLVEAFAIVCIG